MTAQELTPSERIARIRAEVERRLAVADEASGCACCDPSSRCWHADTACEYYPQALRATLAVLSHLEQMFLTEQPVGDGINYLLAFSDLILSAIERALGLEHRESVDHSEREPMDDPREIAR
jgi:hypothetical protein